MKKRSDIELAAELTRSQLVLVDLDDDVAARIAAELVALALQPVAVPNDGAPKATVFSLADARRRRGDGSPKGGGR